MHRHGASKGMWGRGLLGEDMVMKMQPGGVVRYVRISRYVVSESEFVYAHISDW
jgi:hypothetical protein